MHRLSFPGNCATKTGPSTSSWDADYIAFLRKSFEMQTWVFEQASGWIMWTWKTEEGVDWSLEHGIDGGWIPQPIWNKTMGYVSRILTIIEFSTAVYG